MDDDGYHTQQRRNVYQQDGRIGPRGGEGGSGPQRVRILLPTTPSGSSSVMTSPYSDYGQGEDASAPQVIRILPRAVYNLKHDQQNAAGRRGSVDTGLAHVIRMGRNDGGPQVIQLGSGYSDGSNPRVIRIGQGYNPESSSEPQVIRIGPSGRILGSTTQPSGQQQYYTQRPQDVGSREVREASGAYPPQGLRIYTAGVPYSYQGGGSGSESPRIISISSPQPHASGSPSPNMRYSTRPRPEGGDVDVISEWQGQQQDQNPLRAYVQSPSVVGYSSHPGYRTMGAPRTSGGAMDSVSTGSKGFYGNGINESHDDSRGQPQRIHLRDAGRSGSRERFILGSNPVSFQMGGGAGSGANGGGNRRGSLGVVQVIPMRIEQIQTPQYQSLRQHQHQPQQQAPYVYTTSYQDPRSQDPSRPQVIRGRVITSGSDRMGEFDKIIAESIRQFLINRQQQQQQPQQQQQDQGGTSWHPAQSDPNDTPRPSNVEVSEVHIPCGGYDTQPEAGSGPTEDRNLFNKYKFKFHSIGNLSRSNSREEGGGGGGGEDSDTGSGNWSKGGRAPIAIFRFNDFDDMIARMMELRQASQTQPSSDDGFNKTSRGQMSVQQMHPHQVAPEQQEVDNRHNYETVSYSLPRQPTSEGQVQRRKINMPREVLRHKIEVFNSNSLGLIMSLEQEGETFHGFIRVQMNLIRPVQMEVPSQPPTLFDVLSQNPDASGTAVKCQPPTQDDSQTTFFYLPKDTSKVIHINSDTTTKEVIKSLLSKFKIKDNPMKFALYHKRGTDEKSASMRRLNDEEMPLPMCLAWTDEGIEGLSNNKFVLQENDTGEILWDAFSLPELENFLMILNREEDEYIKELKSTYRLLKVQLQKRLKELKRDRIQPENS